MAAEAQKLQSEASPADVLTQLKLARDAADKAIREAEANMAKENALKAVPEVPAEASNAAPPQAQKEAQEQFEAQHGEPPTPATVGAPPAEEAEADDAGDKVEASAPAAQASAENDSGKLGVKGTQSPSAPYGYKKGTNIPKSKPGRKKKEGVAAAPKPKGKPGPKPKADGEGTKWAQSAGPIKLSPDQLNPNERVVLKAITGLANVTAETKSIKDIASDAFPDMDPVKANYQTRNALRRLVPARFADKVERGRYRANKKGMESIIASIFQTPVKGGKSSHS
jgi:colicin import membrane protein